MIGFGLRLAVAGGREALTRLVIIAAAGATRDPRPQVIEGQIGTVASPLRGALSSAMIVLLSGQRVTSRPGGRPGALVRPPTTEACDSFAIRDWVAEGAATGNPEFDTNIPCGGAAFTAPIWTPMT